MVNLRKKKDPLGLVFWVFVCLFLFCAGDGAHVSVYVWRSEDSFARVCFLHHVGSGDQTQAVNLSGKRLYH